MVVGGGDSVAVAPATGVAGPLDGDALARLTVPVIAGDVVAASSPEVDPHVGVRCNRDVELGSARIVAGRTQLSARTNAQAANVRAEHPEAAVLAGGHI